ncbi:MAG: alpha/beta hydrolase [Cyclobacteriaceae bacterium]
MTINSRSKISSIFKKLLAFILLIILIAFCFIWLKSPGKPQPISDQEGKKIDDSISKIESVLLGGIEQYLIIRGADSIKPVLLFLHGGPGSPEFSFLKNPNLELEKNYTVIYWEQRGAGKSYSSGIPSNTMTLSQLISDTRELSLFLKKRFKREKIFLMGHSWGSLLGIMTAHKYPELFHAYIGIGQVSNQYEAEKVSLEWVRERAKYFDEEKSQQELGAISLPNKSATNQEWLNYLLVERSYVNKYGGGMTRERFDTWSNTGRLIIDTKEYTIVDKIKFLKGNFYSMEHLWDDQIEINLFTLIDSLQVPTFFLHGRYDYMTPLVVSKPFIDHLKAPHKLLYIFENSAHSPFLDEPEKFNSVINSIAIYCSK